MFPDLSSVWWASDSSVALRSFIRPPVCQLLRDKPLLFSQHFVFCFSVTPVVRRPLIAGPVKNESIKTVEHKSRVIVKNGHNSWWFQCVLSLWLRRSTANLRGKTTETNISRQNHVFSDTRVIQREVKRSEELLYTNHRKNSTVWTTARFKEKMKSTEKKSARLISTASSFSDVIVPRSVNDHHCMQTALWNLSASPLCVRDFSFRFWAQFG